MRVTPIPKNPLVVIITNNSGNYMKMEKNNEIASLVDTVIQTQYAHITNVIAEQYATKKHDDEIVNINQNQQWYEKGPLPDQTWQTTYLPQSVITKLAKPENNSMQSNM